MIQIKSSPQLYAFYEAYREWLLNGAPNGQPFYANTGLCYNAMRYSEYMDSARRIHREMCEQFDEAGLNVDYPFNADEQDYTAETVKQNNPQRIIWVLSRLLDGRL